MSIKEYRLANICKILNGKDLHANISLSKILTNKKTNMIYVKTSCFENHYQSTPNFYVAEKYINNKFVPKLICNKGDLVISKACDVGEVSYIIYENTAIYRALTKLEPDENILIKKYLFYNLIKHKKYFETLANGTTIKTISLDVIKDYVLILPDKSIQQSIIDIIEPKEKLFLKYHELIDITDIDNFHKTWKNLIDIIEPFEHLINQYKRKKEIFNYIIKNYDVESQNCKILSTIATIKTGKRNANFAVTNGNYSFFTCSVEKEFKCNDYSFDGEYLIVAGNGDVGNVSYFNGKFDAYQRTYLINSIFFGNIYYSLIKNKDYFLKSSNGSVIKFLTIDKLNNLIINLDENLNYFRVLIIRFVFLVEKIICLLNKIVGLLIELKIN